MELSAHHITDLIIETPQTRQHGTREAYQHMNIVAIDSEGREVTLSLFSKDGAIAIHHTEDRDQVALELRRAKRKAKRAEREAV